MTCFRRPIVLVALLAWPAVGFGQQTAARDESLVITSGDGVVQAVPDRAWMSVSAESRAPTPDRKSTRLNSSH